MHNHKALPELATCPEQVLWRGRRVVREGDDPVAAGRSDVARRPPDPCQNRAHAPMSHPWQASVDQGDALVAVRPDSC